MSLQLILGSSGAGKSYRLYKDVIEEADRHPEQNYIVIVPEQYTMETQSKIVNMHHRKGVMNVDIVSFPRLFYRVSEEVGTKDYTILDDTGKSLVLRKVIENNKKLLRTFSNNIKRPGFIEEMKSVISELMQYAVSVEDLENIREKVEGNAILSAKLEDVELLYREYKKYIEDTYISSEELLAVLCSIIPQSEFIKGSVITLDGFTGFTPLQYKLIGILLQLASKVVVTVTVDASERINVIEGPQNIFCLSKTTISRLYSIAEENGIPIEKNIVIDEKVPYRLAGSRELSFLEKNVFRYKGEVYSGKLHDISVYEGENPRNEVDFVVGEIFHIIEEKGYHYKDIAVVSGDMDIYGDLCQKIFDSNNIPVFIDRKRNVMGNLMVEYIRSGLEIISGDYSYEGIFRFLKTGLTDVTCEEADILENYVLALGIRGRKRWHEPWKRVYRTKYEAGRDIERINLIRQKVLTCIDSFDTAMAEAKTVYEYTKAVYEFMRDGGIENKIRSYEKMFDAQGDKSLAGEYRQVWKKIIEMMDKFVELLSDEKMSVKEYTEILDAGLNEIKVGLIPPSKDAVIVGDIERTRLENIKVLFLLGVNDGIIPKKNAQGGILSEVDREALENIGLALSPSARENVFIQRFYLYLVLTKPSEKLYISYSNVGMDGKSLKMSYLVGTVRKLYPDLIIKNSRSEEEILRLVEIPQADRIWSYAEDICLKPEIARELYGEKIIASISKLEKYAECAYAHYVNYGLALEERQVYHIEASDIGTFFHDTLDCFTRMVFDSEYTFHNIPEEIRKSYVKQAVEKVAAEDKNAAFLDSERSRYLIKRVEDMTERTVWAISRQLRQGQFQVEDTEINFYKDIDEDLMLKGRIDRLDVCESDDKSKVYVKVVDYKTGENDFSLLETYYGLRVQLLLYMNAAIEAKKKKYPGKKIIPAGMFYYNIKNPVVEDGEDEDTIEKDILNTLRMKGVVNTDREVMEKLECDRSGKSIAVPVTFDKDGNVKDSKNSLSHEQFEVLLSFVEKQLKESAAKIMEGDISVNPYKEGQETSCDYCEYSAVCGFAKNIPGCRYRRMKKFKDEEIWKMIRGEEDATVDK